MARIHSNLQARLLREIVDGALLHCPRCPGKALAFSGDDLTCAACGSLYPVRDGVANLFLPQSGSSPRNFAPFARAIGQRYGIPAELDPVLIDMIEDSLMDLPPGAIAGEVNGFIDRFSLHNNDGCFELVHHFVEPDHPLPAGETITRSIRVRNCGNFPWFSGSGNPMLLSYHWLNPDGSLYHFEGRRTAYPIIVEPGRELTVPLEVDVPHKPGRYILRVVPVREGVRWFEEHGADIPVRVERKVPAIEVSHPPQTFSEATDTHLAMEMLASWLRQRPLPPRPLLLEVAGGASPESAAIVAGQLAPEARIVNFDISRSLLRLCSLHYHFANPELEQRFAFVCADANELPVPDGCADVVLMARALHHFPDPVRLLAGCARKLKPGGFLLVTSEPVGRAYDAHTIRLLSYGQNEQVFAAEDYLTMFSRARLRAERLRIDWGFSLKTVLTPESGFQDVH